jgi:zinc transporter ZupT
MLVDRGASLWKAVAVSILTSIPQPIIAIPAFLFVQQFRLILPIGLGFAAGICGQLKQFCFSVARLSF